MPFDPAQPADHAPLASLTLRNQFNALHGLAQSAPAGPPGLPGEPGPQGEPGEVSAPQLDAAVGACSANTNAVATLDDTFSDPPTLADFEALRAKMNEFILAARR